MFPDGIITREIGVGPATYLNSGTPVAIRVLISPSRTLIWEGAPVLPSLKTYTIPAGETALIALPVTDQSGYRDTKGRTIVLDPNEHAFHYTVHISYLLNGSVVAKKPTIKALLPSDPTSVDIDELIHFSAGAAGGEISVPNSWSAQVTAAQQAASAAAVSAAVAAAAASGLEGNIDEAVNAWFDANPDAGVSQESLQAALDAHKAEPTPHDAYDLDMPSLSVFFENGLI